ncbi:MAG TPA: MOSC domain-containing protein [Streptosporangiaceae bacterium]|nr:MOSC domain-containing protein [Streptosporangiaceae bacterium]
MKNDLTLCGLFVGTPAPLGSGPQEVLSAIRKQPVAEHTLALGELGLAGDQQADLTVHGGVDKAVYMYPAAHYAYWATQGYDLEPGGAGENASVMGPDEREVRIGDIWTWGTAAVQVTQPRSPCYKFALRAGRKEATAQMIASGLCGWYLRVLRPGTVPTAGSLSLLARDTTAPTVRELFEISFSRDFDPHELTAMLSTPALAPQWRNGAMTKLARSGMAR